MSTTLLGSRKTHISQALAGGFAAFAALVIIFVTTMVIHYQAIDWPYLSWALFRITAISIVTGLILFSIRRISVYFAVGLGAVFGVVCGIAYVAVTTNA